MDLPACLRSKQTHVQAMQLASLTMHHWTLGVLSAHCIKWERYFELVPVTFKTSQSMDHRYFTLKLSSLAFVGRGSHGAVT